MNHFLTVMGWGGTILLALTSGTGSGQAQPPPPVLPSTIAQGTTQTYDGPQYKFPIKTQYPDTMQVEGGCGGEGCGFSFTFLPQNTPLDDAEVNIFIPRGTKTAAEQAVFITGPNGLIENNVWTTTEIGTTTKHLPADWVKNVIHFTTEDRETGQIILGEIEDQAVQVMVIYPTAMAAQFWPAAHGILESLSFDTDLLPLQPSGEGQQRP